MILRQNWERDQRRAMGALHQRESAHQHSGNWRIEPFSVSDEGAQLNAIRSTFSFSDRGRYVPAGEYERLMRGSTVVMSNTPDELRDLWRFQAAAHGTVLINGLGLGCAVKMALEKPIVTTVAVVEISADVIALIAPRFSDPRLTIVCADAFSYKPTPGFRWNVVWHDIWDAICGDNLSEMARLHRKYGRRCDWQGSWCRFQCERAKRG